MQYIAFDVHKHYTPSSVGRTARRPGRTGADAYAHDMAGAGMWGSYTCFWGRMAAPGPQHGISWHDATKLASAFRPGDDFAMKSARVSSESSAMRTKCPATAVSHPGSLRFGPPNIVASRHDIPCGGPDAAG